MPVTVLVVDDSSFFQRRIKEILHERTDIRVVGFAGNGMEAIEKAQELKPDVITMDYEMPMLDGISAVREIMRLAPTSVIMFSSLTYEGARVTLDALDAGAVDFIPKNFAEISQDSSRLKKLLQDRIFELGNKAVPSKATSRAVKPELSSTLSPSSPSHKPKIVVIGASTGGPVALTEVLSKIPADFPVPILLVQHMPQNFTRAFAERLDKLCQISVCEAEDGVSIRPGVAYLAPGGMQMMINPSSRNTLKILAGDGRINYRPSVDITFGSAAKSWGSSVLGVVLTGMGADGCDGAGMIKRAGGSVWSQDQASSVIYGMPMAVAKAKLTDRVLPLNQVASHMNEVVRR